MTEKELIKEIRKSIKQSIADLNEKAAELDKLTAERKSGKYNAEYLNEIDRKLAQMRRDMENTGDNAKKAVAGIISRYTNELKALDELKGEDMTADAQLLNCGVPLTKDDLTAMLNRNSGNSTMTQLILRYAGEHKIDTGVYFIGHSEAIKGAEGLQAVADSIFRYSNDTGLLNTMYDKLAGDNSQIAAIENSTN